MLRVQVPYAQPVREFQRGSGSKSVDPLYLMHIHRWRSVDLPKIVDTRGNLTMIESGRHLPFDIARAYYIYDVPSGSARAGHAHKALRQLFVALSGSFSLHLEDGRNRETFILNRPHSGMLVEAGVWRTIDNFSGGAVCLVLASMHYDETDYLRSYGDFLNYAAKHNQDELNAAHPVL